MIVPVIAVVGLMTMSFTSATEADVKVVKTEFGEKLTNIHLLSLEDLLDLKSMTIKGAKDTNIFHTSAVLDQVNETITKHTDPTDPKKPDEFYNKFNSILAKY